MENPLKILMLEDVEEDAILIERTLKKADIPFISRRVDTKKEFTDSVVEFTPDVILSDHALPQFNSAEALKICISLNIKVPFILVTGTVSEEFAVSCLKQGADDYLLKSNLTRLPSAIQNALRQRKAEIERNKAESSLLEQNNQLTKINKELDRFVYSASHDLRAPLKSILGLVRLAKVDCKEGNVELLQECLMMIEQSIFKLDTTIKEIINYSRNTRTEIYKENIQLKILMDEVFENLQYIEGTEKIEKEIIIDETIPLISDPDRLKIIFNNIISNAIKYHDKEKKRSFISVKIKVSKTKAIIEIKDNGIGIENEYISNIFNMFYRGTEKSEGSGLGLYIVKETLEKLRGTIQVSSEIHKGTLFTVEIPNNLPSHAN
jgi:signal transduction histidine kinase